MKLYVEHIVLLMALEKEAYPIIKHLHMKRLWRLWVWNRIYKAYRVSRGGATITLLLYKYAHETEVKAAYTAIKHFSPDIIISLSTGGGVQYSGARIGDGYIKVGVLKLSQVAADSIDYNIDAYPYPYDIAPMAHKLGLRLDNATTDHVFIESSVKDEKVIPFIRLQVISDYFADKLVSKQQSEKNINYAIECLDKKFTMMVDTLIHDGLAAI